MRELQIEKNDAGQRVDNFLMKALPKLPASLRQKFLRTKYIKLNGRRCQPSDRLNPGDTLQFYINDAFFEKPKGDEGWQNVAPELTVVYEDENILIADKPAGLLVHSDESGDENTLINRIKAYLHEKGEWDPKREQSFTPALANRIDRNTGGLVLAAKNAAALRALNEQIKNRDIKKYYYCLVHGKMTPPSGRLESYLERDMNEKRVFIKKTKTGDSRTAVTKYKTLAYKDGLSLLECELITGRTHQIRAQFAAAGHALLGDGKYGSNEENRAYRRRYQALYSYKAVFTSSEGDLGYLAGREFTSPRPDFVESFMKSGGREL